MFCKEPKIPSFYMLPKIHKNLENPPGRPIISGNESLTEPASEFVDFFLKPFVSGFQFTFKITRAQMDVKSLSKNTDHTDGLEAVKQFLNSRPPQCLPPVGFILQLNGWTLKNNVFLFQDMLYKHVKGTAMGACFASNYAKLFLGLWEDIYTFYL